MIPVPPDVLAALARDYQLPAGDLAALDIRNPGADGKIYTFTQDGQPRVFKVLAIPQSDRYGLLRLEERLRLMHHLGQGGAPVVHPLPRPGEGALYTTCPTPDHLFVAYTMPFAAGRHPKPDDWSPELLRAWGRLVGATHRMAQTYPVWQRVEAGEGPERREVLGWRSEWQDFYDGCRDPQVKEYWLVLRGCLEALPIARDSFGFIHNDPHMENLLYTPTPSGPHLTLLDFDVANCHWFITDISIAVQSVLFRVSGGMDSPVRDLAPAQRFLEHFMEGYRTENTLDPAWLGHLNLLINYRRALLFTVMQDWIETKPDLHARWKKMILDEEKVF